jgi:hypothetical protein
MGSRVPKIASLASLLLLLLTAPARGDVLVSRPPSSIHCGDPITTGVWYRDFPTRDSHRATIQIRSASNAVLSRRAVIATDTWRYFRYTPRCGRHYRVRYITAAATTTFEVRVRKP